MPAFNATANPPNPHSPGASTITLTGGSEHGYQCAQIPPPTPGVTVTRQQPPNENKFDVVIPEGLDPDTVLSFYCNDSEQNNETVPLTIQ